MKQSIKINTLICLNFLSLGPWLFCALFITAFAFDAPGSTSNLLVVIPVLLIWGYPILVCTCSFYGRRQTKKNISHKRGWVLLSTPLLIPSFIFLFFLYKLSVGNDILERDSFQSKKEKNFISICAEGNNQKLLEQLEAGANPNLTSTTDMTPLLVCYVSRNINNFELLLKNGADPNHIPNNNLTNNIAGYILSDSKEDWKKDGIPYIKMLFSFGLNPSLRNDINFLTKMAYEAREKDYIKLFVENGADISIFKKGELSQLINFERWHLALLALKRSTPEEFAEAEKYLKINIEHSKEQNDTRTEFIDAFKKKLKNDRNYE